MTTRPRLFVELRRRNVFRAATFYAASAWLLVEVVTQLVPVFDIPGDSDIETKTLEKHVWVLRQKLEPDPRNPQYIVNVRGVGYKFEGD